MKHFLKIAAVLAACAWASSADAVSRFWNPYIVTGAVTGTTNVGQCKLTISPAIAGSGLLAGDTVVVTGISLTTGSCNGTFTVSNVDSPTTIELAGSTFGTTYISGGCVSGGHWTTTNTANWATSSTATCGQGGNSVPSTADSGTIDANSLTGTVKMDAGVSGTAITNITLNGNADLTAISALTISNTLSVSGSNTRNVNLGTANYSIIGSASTGFDCSTSTGLTLTANTATFTLTSTVTGQQTFTPCPTSLGGNSGIGTLTINSRTTGASIIFPTAVSISIGQLNVTGPAVVVFAGNATTTISTGLSATGTATGPIQFASNSLNSAATVATIALTGTTNMTWGTFHNMGVTGGTINATSSIDFGGNTGNLTITAPSAGGGRIIGG